MLLLFSAATSNILSRCFRFVNNFFHLFSRWSAEGGIWTLAPLLTTCTLSRGVPSASWVLLQSPDAWTSVNIILSSASLLLVQRREWDSNPRALADKRFSRPPRYDHFDISPQTCFTMLPKAFVFVKNFFKFFIGVSFMSCSSHATWWILAYLIVPVNPIFYIFLFFSFSRLYSSVYQTLEQQKFHRTQFPMK